MKYRLSLSLLIIYFLILSTQVLSHAEEKSTINKLNIDIEDHYSEKNYFQSSSPYGEFNYDVLNIYNLPVYGYPHGDKKLINGIMEPRFIGYANTGESVPNPNYTADSSTGRDFTSMNWYLNPWNESDIYSWAKFSNIRMTPFDTDENRQAIYNSFFQSISERYSVENNNGLDRFDELVGKTMPWQLYYHVLIPPTSTTRGIVILFHNDGRLHYLHVNLKALDDVKGSVEVSYLDIDTNEPIAASQTLEFADGENVDVLANEIGGYQFDHYILDKSNESKPTTSFDSRISYTFTLDVVNSRHQLTLYYKRNPLAIDDNLSGQITISSDYFDVKQAIPTGESVDVQATISKPYLFNYSTKLVTGSNQYWYGARGDNVNSLIANYKINTIFVQINYFLVN